MEMEIDYDDLQAILDINVILICLEYANNVLIFCPRFVLAGRVFVVRAEGGSHKLCEYSARGRGIRCDFYRAIS